MRLNDNVDFYYSLIYFLLNQMRKNLIDVDIFKDKYLDFKWADNDR